MSEPRKASKRTIILLAISVIGIWGYIGFKIKSSATSRVRTESPTRARTPQADLLVIQGGTTYRADFEDPFFPETVAIDQVDELLPDLADTVPVSSVTPHITLQGTIGRTAIVATDSEVGIVGGVGDSIATGVMSDVAFGHITMRFADSLITFKMGDTDPEHFSISKPN